jgi:hypothetical protein
LDFRGARLGLVRNWNSNGDLYSHRRPIARTPQALLIRTRIACIECLFVLFGTILGVFTIVALSRGSVKSLFEVTQTTG